MKIHKCEECGKEYSCLDSLNWHIKKVHEGQKPHKCLACGLEFGFMNVLKNHLETIHEKKYIHNVNILPNRLARSLI